MWCSERQSLIGYHMLLRRLRTRHSVWHTTSIRRWVIAFLDQRFAFIEQRMLLPPPLNPAPVSVPAPMSAPAPAPSNVTCYRLCVSLGQCNVWIRYVLACSQVEATKLMLQHYTECAVAWQLLASKSDFSYAAVTAPEKMPSHPLEAALVQCVIEYRQTKGKTKDPAPQQCMRLTSLSYVM